MVSRSTLGLLALLLVALPLPTLSIDKAALKKEAYEMFMHGYRSYMRYAWPADELMPLSCKGRQRGVTPSRGDVDEALGNFSLTLVDALDTLYVVGEFEEFAKSVKLIVDNVRFDSDIVVSVFETNIRMLGGLISGHLMAERLRGQDERYLQWYTDRQLLKMAIDLADRLLPAFNTSSGIPLLEWTLLLEFAALSRLTGNPIYEEKAKKAMDFLWAQRHRASDLMGTVLNVHSGDWVRRDSGIGAGIDSYYEYCLKAYILLGDHSYLERFNKHYDAVMRYVNKGPFFVDVHMHRPTVATRSFMDALLAFWPGLQVLKGDVREAIEMHEMLFQVVKRHKFLPEAFTHDFQVHWAEHPLRPEFIESTYFLYRSTHDEHYLEVAKLVMDSLNENVKVSCGFAGIKDIRTMVHEDRMDSFVLSETFKYLYMIFSEPEDLPLDPDQYVMTTEAHFLPLSMANPFGDEIPRKIIFDAKGEEEVDMAKAQHANPWSHRDRLDADLPKKIRERTKSVLEEVAVLQAQHGQTGAQCMKPSERLKAWAFNAQDSEHLRQLRQMGIELQVQTDGRIQLSHQSTNALSDELAKWGVEFMKEVVEMSKKLAEKTEQIQPDYYVQLLSFPYLGKPVLLASPAQFGKSLDEASIEAELILAEPFAACGPLMNAPQAKGKIVGVHRGDCMFQEKARNAQNAGAVGVIVIDNKPGTSADKTQPFAMSGDLDKEDDITIPAVFLFRNEGQQLLSPPPTRTPIFLRITLKPYEEDSVVESYLKWGPRVAQKPTFPKCFLEEGYFVRVEPPGDAITFQFRLAGVNQDSDPLEHQGIVERHVGNLLDVVEFSNLQNQQTFFNFLRTSAYGALGLNVKDEPLEPILKVLKDLKLHREPADLYRLLPGEMTRAFRFLYNDDSPLKESDGNRGHAKGVLNFDRSTGFWMIHSVPNYPPLHSYSYPKTATKYGQSFLCITVSTENLNAIGDHLKYIQATPFDIGLPDDFAQKYPVLRTIAQKKSISTSTVKYTFEAELTTKGGTHFHTFAKHKKFKKDIWYDLIVPTMGVSLGVQSWLNGQATDLKSECGSHGNVNDIDEITVLGARFPSSKDHSKWGVSDDARRPIVCIGDLNRQTSQLKRGGGALCIENSKLWETYRSSASHVSACRSNGIVGGLR
ncbi:unnamed protein product, partial [Mesorhabditis belari]|uniref:alpha-1,2-Mannosidase n=1 Tax=Mesorhabditis belari TaxID=2138241 RepID=A0AAF3F8W7_9BILA